MWLITRREVNKTNLEMTVVELTDMDFSKAIMKINLKGF